MKRARGNGRNARPDAASKNGKRRLEKAIGTEKRAMKMVRQMEVRLVHAVQTLATAKAQSTKEEKAARLVRAATKDLLSAKRKLRKAQKKSQRVATQSRLGIPERARAPRDHARA